MTMFNEIPPVGPQCATFAPLLPLARQRMLDDGQQADLMAHVAGCAHCRAELAAFDRLDAALRRTLPALAGDAPNPAALVQAALAQGTDAPLPLAHAPFAFISEEYMPDHAPHVDTRGTALPVTTQHKQPPRLLFAGISSVAAVVLLALLAQFIFAGHHQGPPGGVATSPTPVLTVPPGAFKGVQLLSVSLDSPIDGWAVGTQAIAPTIQATPDLSPRDQRGVFYHYMNGVWQPVSVAAIADQRIISLQIVMVAANDGWAIALKQVGQTGVVLHYDGTTWQSAPSPMLGAGEVPQFLQMLSPTSGWMVTLIGNDHPIPHLWRYDGTSWSQQAVPDLSKVEISALAMVSPNEGWLAGDTLNAQGSPDAGVFYHYLNGTWQLQQTLPGIPIASMSFAAPDAGWALSSTDVYGAQGTMSVLVRYHAGRWTPLPSNTLPHVGQNPGQLRLFAPNDGWLPITIVPAGGAEQLQFYHYDGTRWALAQQLALPQGAEDIQCLAIDFNGGVGWAVGTYSLSLQNGSLQNALFVRYVDGKWSYVTPSA